MKARISLLLLIPSVVLNMAALGYVGYRIKSSIKERARILPAYAFGRLNFLKQFPLIHIGSIVFMGNSLYP